jgi:mannose-6-phosphate isomerase
LNKFSSKPYKLFNTIQNYEWGTRNEAAFIPRFLGIPVEPDTPYGELWIGAHPKAPSKIEIDGTRVPLNDVVHAFPAECLGAYVCKNFSNTFPFLLKILSAARALSIQTHPNKSQAERLHAKDPKNYPDDNHKPEVAIAIDSLVALAGFKPVQAIEKNLESLPELSELVGQDLIDRVLNSSNLSAEKNLIKKMYRAIMQHAEDTKGLTACISQIRARLMEKTNRSSEEEQFLETYELYGADVGLISFFFFNLVRLQSGEAMFTDAGIPHAYIKGTICECMANSDNVVRAGLTNKFKDVPTLLDIVRYDFAECPIMQTAPEIDEVTYRTTAKEFEVSRIKKSGGFRQKCVSHDRPGVYLIMNGSLKVYWKTDRATEAETFVKGESFFVPASLNEYEFVSEQSAEFFAVAIP